MIHLQSRLKIVRDRHAYSRMASFALWFVGFIACVKMIQNVVLASHLIEEFGNTHRILNSFARQIEKPVGDLILKRMIHNR